MTQSSNLSNRVDRLENDNIDIKLAVSSLIETVNLHQRNFEVIVAEIRQMQANFDRTQASIDQMQVHIQGLQTENRRLLDHLFGQDNNRDA